MNEVGVRKGLELIVEETAPGQFYWSVLGREVFGQARRTIDRAAGPLASYRQAVAAGAVAMRSLIEPKPMGPRPTFTRISTTA